ncbi:PKD domain-containing protein [Allosalinactinospora lopnorensis]|uniref:PKD domain-containing protein n=1 Tax=Allosalinactinospora lopnorensis TaxID=1352348 RepID=UPI000623CEB9|nr:PKD domain-containing protein [Allosalinactinospora lopnorensis]
MSKARRLSPAAAITAGLVLFPLAAPAAAASEESAGALQQARWVAMGDSFQSGVGTGEFDEESGECLRSPLSHVNLLNKDGSVPGKLDFVACRSADIDDLYAGQHGEPPQMDAVRRGGEEITHVTVGVGGNDLGYSDVLRDCILYGWVWSSCASRYDDQVQEKFDEVTAAAPETGLNGFETLYTDIRAEVDPDSATVAAITYPRFFPVDGGSDWSSILFQPRCNNIRVSDQLWINNWIRRMNNAIEGAARSTGTRPVDLYDASEGHELCNPASNEDYLNGIRFDPNAFHPTRFGYAANADAIRSQLDAEPVLPVSARSRQPAQPHRPPRTHMDLHQDGAAITADASGSTKGDGSLEIYLWEFDDGEIDEGESVTHRYEEPGAYYLTLTVIDSNGEMGFSAPAEITVG